MSPRIVSFAIAILLSSSLVAASVASDNGVATGTWNIVYTSRGIAQSGPITVRMRQRDGRLSGVLIFPTNVYVIDEGTVTETGEIRFRAKLPTTVVTYSGMIERDRLTLKVVYDRGFGLPTTYYANGDRASYDDLSPRSGLDLAPQPASLSDRAIQGRHGDHACAVACTRGQGGPPSWPSTLSAASSR